MKRQLKKIVYLFVCVLIIFAFLPPVSIAYAKSCNHDYGQTDVCKKCGNLRIHYFDYSITVRTAKANVPVWNKPTKYSKLVKEITDSDVYINIDGILRNQYGNIWFKISGKDQYIYIDNIYIDFFTLVLQNYQQIFIWEKPETQLAAFYDLVKPGGEADYKCWLDPGGKEIQYTVRFMDNYYSMTAQELGNIHYGYLGRVVGIDSNILLYAGGIVNQWGKLQWDKIKLYAMASSIACSTGNSRVCVTAIYKPIKTVVENIYHECSSSYCDEQADAINVEKGINYYDTGLFAWD